MFKAGDEVVLPLKIEKICNEELVGAKSEADVTYLFKIEEANRVLKPRELKTYTQGLADAWELAKKIYDMTCTQVEKIFGVDGGFWNVVREITVEEALAKIEAYEREKEIKVGDVVVIDDDVNALVIDEISEESVFVLTENGCIETRTKKYLEKTDKKISISDLLRQIGE